MNFNKNLVKNKNVSNLFQDFFPFFSSKKKSKSAVVNTPLSSSLLTFQHSKSNKQFFSNSKIYSQMNSDFNEFRNTENSNENKKKNGVSLNQKRSNSNSSNSRFGFAFGGNQKQGQKEIPKQQVVSITYEEIGLFPRSFNRVFDRFFKQLFFDVENLVIQEYRFYRYLFLTTVKCVFILVFVPLSVNFIAKNYFVRPITEYYWNTHQTEIFLNSYQQKRAFTELKNFEEKIYFESLIFPSDPTEVFEKKITRSTDANLEQTSESKIKMDSLNINLNQETVNQNRKFSEIFTQSIQTSLQIQTVELAKHYNEESIEAITNFFADFISLSTLFVLLFHLEIQINITKSFLLEVFFGLDDSKKSLLILFVTDLLVGYHSPNIWELFFSTIFDHYGLPESQTTIFLLVATLPVLLDVLFKYLIFRHLNRASPATVATYHAMIE